MEDFDTPHSLLGRLLTAPEDRDWHEFYTYFEPAVIGYVMKRTGDRDLAVHTLQAVMISLMRRLETFEYDPKRSFCSYVFTAVHHRMLQLQVRKARMNEISLEAVPPNGVPLKDLLPAGDVPDYTAEDERSFRRLALREALERVDDARVNPDNIRLFLDHVLEGVEAQELADKYEKEVNAVYQAIHQWKPKASKLVRQYLEELEQRKPDHD